MTHAPKLVVECAGSFKVKVLGNGRVEISMDDVSGELPNEVIYDKKGVARRLGSSVRSVENFMKQKRHPLPFIRYAGHPKFRESDVLWWLEQGCSVAARRAVKRSAGIIS